MKTSGIKRYRNPSQRLDKWGYLFIAPFVLVFLVFSLYPMIYSIILSFTNENLTSSGAFENFTSIDNYRWIFSQRQFWQSFLNTLIIFIMNFIPQIVSALFFAVLFSSKRIRMKGKGFFQFVYFLPNILTATSVAALFLFLFGYIQTIDGTPRGGPFYQFLLWLGMDDKVRLFNEVWPTRIIIAFVQFWMWFGNSMIVYISGIKGISDEVFEAADMDGSSPFQTFFNITLPILKPIMLYSLITSLIGGLQMFDIPFLIGSVKFKDGSGISGTLTITAYIYQFMKVNEDYSIASAASVILFIVSLSLSILMYFLFFKPKDYSKKVMKKVRKYGIAE